MYGYLAPSRQYGRIMGTNYIEYAPLIFSLLAIFGSVYSYLNSSKQRKADEAGTLTDTAMKLVNELQEELDRLKNKVTGLQSHVENQDTQYKKIASKYNVLSNDFHAMEVDLYNVRQELSKVEVERDNLALRVASLTDEIKTLSRMNLDLVNQITKLQGTIKEWDQKNVL